MYFAIAGLILGIYSLDFVERPSFTDRRIASNAPAQKIGKPEHYVIIINTHVSDIAAPGNFALEEGQAIARLEKQFPRSTFVSIHGATNDEIKSKLRSYGEPNVKIDGLYVMSHGASVNYLVSRKDERLLANDPEGLINRKRVSIIASENGKFYVELNNRESFNKVFSPIVGKFSLGAKIIFGGCSTIEVGTKEEKLIVMKRIAKNFGLRSGAIYMNETPGQLSVRAAFEQPFFEQKGIQKLYALMIQAIAPISLPILYFKDQMNNRGYLLKIDPRGYRLYEDRFQNAEKKRFAATESNSPLVSNSTGKGEAIEASVDEDGSRKIVTNQAR